MFVDVGVVTKQFYPKKSPIIIVALTVHAE
jgi:hypothetical protein